MPSSFSESGRIALFLYSLDGGGAEGVMANLACNFVKRGLKVDLVLVRAKGPFLSQLSPEVHVVELKASKTLTCLPDLIRYLRREKPAVMLSTMHYANEMALWAKQLSRTSTKVFVTEQNTVSLYARQTSRKVEKWTPLSAKLFYPWADGIIACSHDVAKDLSQVTGLPLKSIQVIYNPVLTPELAAKAAEPIDHPWFAPGEPPVILGAGRLVGQKDFATLIRSFAIVRQSRPARLMILGGNAGSGPTLEALVKELELTDDVVMPGFKENYFAYLAKADVFVLSSRWEGLPTVLIHAMAVGAPIVSTDCKSGPAEILDQGKYGTLVPVGNPEAMAEAILKTLAGETKRADSDWLSQFNVDTVTNQYLEFLGF